MRKITILLLLMLGILFGLQAQQYNYSDSWGKAGFNLVATESSAIEVVYSVPMFALEDQVINGESMKNIMLPGNFLFNDAGAPNLPGNGRYIAIPEGSTPSLRIISQRTEVFQNVEILPAPILPTDNDDNPMVYSKNMDIYGKNAFYPASPVTISEVNQIRGTDAVILGITPFQYNPVTKELIVYRDLQIAIDCDGGTGVYGDDRLRSPYWDGLMSDAILNYSVLPAIDYAERMNQTLQNPTEDDECEYIIISPTGDDFLRWADSIAKFRNEQGILTKVFTVEEVGGNTTNAIETFINNAYNTWNTPPAACLLLGDYGTDPAVSIIAPIWNSYCASDNIYADVDGDQMPDVIFARMTANNNAQLTVFITKFLDYERSPVTDPDFYNHPITALGWQTERWFQICSEVVGGYFREVKGREPTRINAIYQGTPGSIWSSAPNTSTVVNYFGPNGLGYIPATPTELGGWSGGTSTMVTNAINAGAFLIQHRDHGNITRWGEPAYNNDNINQLTNDKLIHVFSINCLTGKYNISSECFTEKFHRHTKNGYNSGALSVTGASETSYSFVNDTYVWGLMDNMWPDFMPNETSEVALRGLMPAFGNAGGKYFLKQSSWPYNTNSKAVTYNLFHHHGDAFSCLYDTVPSTLFVTPDSTILCDGTPFTVRATDSSLIAISNNGELLAIAYGAGAVPVAITLPSLPPESKVKIVVTKRNFFRYEKEVPSSPHSPATPQGDTELCEASTGNLFTTDGTPLANSYEWIIDPTTAGTITGTGTEITLDVAESYTGSAVLRVRGINDCGNGGISDALTLTVVEVLAAPAAAPDGPAVVDLKEVASSDFTATEVTGAIGYTWMIDPETAGDLNPNGLQLSVTWDPDFRGDASITYAGVTDDCEGHFSPAKLVTVKNTLGINEFNAYNISVYPNPNTGRFNLSLYSNEQGVVSIKIFNLLGTMVYNEEGVTVFNKLTKTLDLSTLPKGIYHLKVEGAKGTSIIRVVIDR
ncbi:C25 family cysteine peptidase [Bacteroidota bacterium]